MKNFRRFEIPKFGQLCEEDGYNVTLGNVRTQRMLEDAVKVPDVDVQVIDPATSEQWIVEWRKDPNDPNASMGLFVMCVSVGSIERDRSDQSHLHKMRMNVQDLRDALDGRSGNQLAADAFRIEIEDALAHNKDIIVIDSETGDNYRVCMDASGNYKIEGLAVFGN